MPTVAPFHPEGDVCDDRRPDATQHATDGPAELRRDCGKLAGTRRWVRTERAIPGPRAHQRRATCGARITCAPRPTDSAEFAPRPAPTVPFPHEERLGSNMLKLDTGTCELDALHAKGTKTGARSQTQERPATVFCRASRTLERRPFRAFSGSDVLRSPGGIAHRLGLHVTRRPDRARSAHPTVTSSSMSLVFSA